jgi:hypothetical protein
MDPKNKSMSSRVPSAHPSSDVWLAVCPTEANPTRERYEAAAAAAAERGAVSVVQLLLQQQQESLLDCLSGSSS